MLIERVDRSLLGRVIDRTPLKPHRYGPPVDVKLRETKKVATARKIFIVSGDEIQITTESVYKLSDTSSVSKAETYTGERVNKARIKGRREKWNRRRPLYRQVA